MNPNLSSPNFYKSKVQELRTNLQAEEGDLLLIVKSVIFVSKDGVSWGTLSGNYKLTIGNNYYTVEHTAFAICKTAITLARAFEEAEFALGSLQKSLEMERASLRDAFLEEEAELSAEIARLESYFKQES